MIKRLFYKIVYIQYKKSIWSYICETSFLFRIFWNNYRYRSFIIKDANKFLNENKDYEEDYNIVRYDKYSDFLFKSGGVRVRIDFLKYMAFGIKPEKKK